MSEAVFENFASDEVKRILNEHIFREYIQKNFNEIACPNLKCDYVCIYTPGMKSFFEKDFSCDKCHTKACLSCKQFDCKCNAKQNLIDAFSFSFTKFKIMFSNGKKCKRCRTWLNLTLDKCDHPMELRDNFEEKYETPDWASNPPNIQLTLPLMVKRKKPTKRERTAGEAHMAPTSKFID